MPKAPKCRYCKALSSLCKNEYVVELRDGELFIGGLQPTPQQVEEMTREIDVLKQFSVWHVLTETVKAQALNLGIRNATDFDQLMFAKAMLHVVEIQESATKAIVKEYGHQKKNVLLSK